MVVFNVRNLNVWFGAIQALREVNMQVLANEILGVIGPANSGKTSFLRMLNRMNELQPNFIMSGSVDFASQNIMRLDVEGVRRRIGMVFALPLPLPLSIFDNICYGV